MKVKFSRYWISFSLIAATLLSIFLHATPSTGAQSAQKELLKMTAGYTPIAGATLPFFIAVEDKIFQKHGLEISPVFMGGSPLINAALLAGEFPIGYTGGGAILSSRLAGSDLIAIASPSHRHCPSSPSTVGRDPRSSPSPNLGVKELALPVSARRVTSQRYRCWNRAA
jgi:ABC-type nitrate/sulfonate/bicarbonate transport system substrate-binding protein